ncbi:hypothetical protein F4802DRAFT_593527 [Xylaria palmicola]|nr:hypothetical protein F4802DRAFT_593527 [Xylaria palmicola]
MNHGRQTIQQQAKQPVKPKKESVVWVPGMQPPRGLAHTEDFKTRLKTRHRAHGEGTIDNPRIVWACRPPPQGVEEIENIVREQTSKCLQSFVWITMGIHNKSTVLKTIEADGVSRIMADDDPHVTIRMGPSATTIALSGHLYVHQEVRGVQKVATRLMTEDERSVINGRPVQMWVWGDFNSVWERRGPVLPVPPFPKKPGRG